VSVAKRGSATTRGWRLWWVAVLWAAPLAAQSQPHPPVDAAVEDSLRRVLGARPIDTVFVERLYDRFWYPSATFYRTTFVPTGGVDIGGRRLGAVVVGDSVLVVRDVVDAGRAWGRVARSPGMSRGGPRFGRECLALLSATGLVAHDARIVLDAKEISEDDRRYVDPQSALRGLKSQARDANSDGFDGTVWDGRLLRLRCLNSSATGLTIELTQLASGRSHAP
jgi:hypothetical protein